MTPGARRLRVSGSQARLADARRPWDRATAAARGFAATTAVLATVALASVAAGWPATTYRVGSSSMEPTLRCRAGPDCRGDESDRVVVDRVAYVFRTPRRGDIVAIRLRRPGVRYCASGGGVLLKRIVAVPGDPLPAAGPPSARRSRTTSGSAAVLESDRFYVAGDDRDGSCDSRAFGAVSRHEILGRVFGIVWPLSRVRLLHD